MNRIEVNVQTGEQRTIALTDAEIAELQNILSISNRILPIVRTRFSLPVLVLGFSNKQSSHVISLRWNTCEDFINNLLVRTLR